MNAPIEQLPRIAVLGAGRVGSAMARVTVEAGYDVSMAASADPEKIALIAQIVTPGAVPRWAADAIARADVVMLAIPLHRFDAFDASSLDGKLVVDLMNYWAPTDGVQQLFESELSSSEIVQRRLTGSTVVKAFNHIGYHELESERRPVGAVDRKALGVASDDAAAAHVVARIVERIGYDVVTLDSLAAGRSFEPGGPVFGATLDSAEFDAAVRVSQAA